MAWAKPRFRRDTFGLAAQLAVKVYVCEGCGLWHFSPKPAQCKDCGRMDFIRFDSQAEAKRWASLRLLEAQGKITELRRQVRFPLLAFGGGVVGFYVADFVYREDGARVVEDLKGDAITDLSAWKCRHMAAQGTPVKLVKA